LGVTHLVSIGGDDTAFSANKVYKSSQGRIRVAHVPKTIDNDIPLPGWMPTFGFETARELGTELAVALGDDAKTTSRWYIVVSMGRAAGHLALGIGKAAAAHLTLIPEEFAGRPVRNHSQETPKEELDGFVRFEELVDIIMGSILKRRAVGKEYGMVVLAEGLIESIGIKWLREAMAKLAEKRGYNATNHYGTMKKDKHGHLRLGEIEFGRMMKDALETYGHDFNLDLTFVDKDLGYELRCAAPISFDVEYTRNLGYSAVKYLMSPDGAKDGALISFCQGKMEPLHFAEIFADKDRLPTRRVGIDSESYEVALHYMYRLERSDFDNADVLRSIAKGAGKTEQEFRDRFSYLVGLGPTHWL
jgi:ATP-dependent phosphofructokinase / diphosphate-dependent phosphofructokinase